MSISVKNFDKYQHRDASRRRRGGLLFIRIDVGTRREPEFTGRGGRARYGQWCAILEWAGETANAIPCEPAAWRREFGTHWADVVAWFVNSGKIQLSDKCPTCVRLVPNSDTSRTQLGPEPDKQTAQTSQISHIPAGKPAGHSAGTEEKREEKDHRTDRSLDEPQEDARNRWPQVAGWTKPDAIDIGLAYDDELDPDDGTRP